MLTILLDQAFLWAFPALVEMPHANECSSLMEASLHTIREIGLWSWASLYLF